MSATPVSMDPRIRDRRIEVQREAGRKRLRLLLLAMGTFVALGVAYLIVQSPILDVDHVRITGTRNVTPDDVRSAAGVELGEPLLRVDTGQVARRIEALAWVQNARVERDLPGSLRVTITEHRPAAFVKNPSGGVSLIAPDGRVIARADAAPAGAVELLGVRRVPAVGALVSPPGAAALTRDMPAELAQHVVAVDVGGNGITLRLARGGEVRLGSLDDLRAKAASALAVLAHRGDGTFSYLDVSTPESPVVGHAPSE
jgi:cell division protein FtsQ